MKPLTGKAWIGVDVGYNALNETLEEVDNILVDVESYQLLVVDHKHVVEVEADPLLLKDDHLVEHHTFHVEVEQKPNKLNKRLSMMNHLQLEPFCTENRQHLMEVHQHRHLKKYDHDH
jgi:hypothetical protein